MTPHWRWIRRAGRLALAALALMGCAVFGGAAQEATEVAATTPTSPPTIAITLAPTLPPESAGGGAASPAAPEGGGSTSLAPTPLPPPTQIGAGTPGAVGTGTATIAPPAGGSGDGISIDPQLGEPGEIIVVNGSGFAPSEKVSLHWAKPDGPTGPVYYELTTDESGNFNVGLIVPPAESWPGGAPKEGDYIQLRAKSASLGDFYYWANFRYIKRFNPVTSLVQTYTNSTYGYAIDLPNAWTWSWKGDDTSDVRFYAPSPQKGWGFIRVLNTGNVQSAIDTIMAAEFSGQTYTKKDIGAGKYPGTEIKTSGGTVVWFVPSGSRTYVLTFTDNEGKFYQLVAASFRFTNK